MKWLEEIRLRTQPQKEKEVIEILLEMAESVNKNKEPGFASVYFHQAQPGGFSLILQWNTASIPMNGSNTAMLIIGGIESLGLFDHTVMVESGKTVKVNFNGRTVI